MFAHASVLLEEALGWLDPKPGSVLVDGTLGCCGHALSLLKRIGPEGHLIGFDIDPEAVREAKRILKDFGEHVMIFQENFKNITSRLDALHVKANGVLLDLGVSSPQFDQAQRGFSFSKDGPLDMRMDPQEPLTAREIVNRYPERELADIFWKYGEERYSRRIAKRIVETRGRVKINTTSELESIVWQAVPVAARHGRIHPATKVFQALRIEVNQEIESLDGFLSSVLDRLETSGRVVIISFHSLEDRLVKRAFREYARQNKGVTLTKKPVVPQNREIEENPRSRSAKLRAFQKI
ncbi:MAG: 16S rRNA (cytosine(1402)-N(4))-methyltransferase [Candidatus Omnitrophica bacterium CG07_land_8_20_14_0_80_50_8]|nr:MAG: 16S rRNA (cytosine(1402)-N(4))-methyltransferase [Candidatus Omnitrophica bacterium CG07_land_8_20_14_0_80_50_8]